MTRPPSATPPRAAAATPTGIGAIQIWLESPTAEEPADEIAALLLHLAALRASQLPLQLRAMLIDELFQRGMRTVDVLLPSLAAIQFPITRRHRRQIRQVQEMLGALSDDLQLSLNDTGLHSPQDNTPGQILRALYRHLLASYLSASPASVDIWQHLHRIHGALQRFGANAQLAAQHTYFSAILLGCAQPAAFSSSEIMFIADYLDRSQELIDPPADTGRPVAPTFWIDPSRDAAATACARKAAPPAYDIIEFSCQRLAARIQAQLAALETGIAPQQLNLPDFAATQAGRGVLRRLVTHWGDPGKRRFPRRRQSYRATLISGLPPLWHMLQHGEHLSAGEPSVWMIVNESPDGYALMHVSGDPGNLAIGEIIGMRSESANEWQICIIRWALSENQEHIELGLQVLATRATPALLAQASTKGAPERLAVLLLPEIPLLRNQEMLVAPSGSLTQHTARHVLVVEKNNVEIREVRRVGVEEQNSRIETFLIEADSEFD